MSVDHPSPLTDDDDIKHSKSTSERPFSPDQGLTDQRLKHLKDEILPFYPFLLSVPTDVPFRLGSHFVNNWAVGNDGPFTVDEHQLQYMTFLTHHESDSLLVAVGDWSDGTGSIMPDQRSGPQSAASTPSSGSVKKKISLNDYKNKWKGGASASPVSREAASQSASMSHVLDDKQRASKSSSFQQGDHRPASSTASLSQSSTVESAGRKRPPDPEREHFLKSNDGKPTGNRSPKKPRVSPDRIVNRKSDQSKPNGLPALLSPTLPPTSDSRSLPQLLSPTLPPSIEKELASIRDESPPQEPSQKRTTSTSDGSTEGAARVTLSNLDAPPLDSVHSPGFQDLQGKPTDTEMDWHGPESSENPKTNGLSQIADKPSQPVFSEVTSGTYLFPDNSRRTNPGISDKRQVIVKLKYGRLNRKRVEALLKFSGKRKVAASRSPVKGSSDRESVQSKKEDPTIPRAPVSDDFTPISHRPGKKIRHGPSDAPVVPPRERSRDRKIAAVSEKPQTPMSVPHQHGKPKPITPVKDPKFTSSRHMEPTDSDGKTPYTQGTKYPAGDSGTAIKLSPPQFSGQASRSRNCERRAWRDEYQKYGNLGRELKHAAERHTAKDDATAADEKTAAATALEAIICFILAFVADDQSKALARQIGDSSAWISIIAYWRVVKKNSAPYPQLYSLCLILGAVSYDAIHALDLDRLAISPLPGEHAPIPTPAGDGSLMSEEKKNRKELLELKARLPECYKESQRLWAEGTKGLSEDTLGRDFPMTWKNRSRRYSERGKQPLKPGDYSGEYFLPLGRTDTPVEVVRFGWSILNEWCTNEGLHWHARLNL